MLHWLAAALLWASPAMAQLGEPDEWLAVQARAGGAIRNGLQADNGPGVAYSGATGNDLGLTAGWYPGSFWGATASFAREAFSLSEAGVRVANVSLIRFALGPTFRWSLGPVRLEPGLSYAFAQIPVFGDSSTPVALAAQRHAVMLRARVGALFGRLWFEVNGELPLVVASSGPSLVAASAVSGGAVGVGARVDLVRWAPATLGLRADVQFLSDTLNVTGGTSAQSVWRIGGGLEITLRDEPPPAISTSASLRVAVASASKAQPLDGAAVELQGSSDSRQAFTDARGVAVFAGVPAGSYELSVRKTGFDSLKRPVAVTTGQDASVDVALVDTPDPTGGLEITVSDALSRAPLAEVLVKVGALQAATDGEGKAAFNGLKVGNVAIDARKAGYTPASEAAAVVSGRATAIAIALAPEKKKVPAIVSGLVRGAKDGSPVVAQLEIPEAGIKVKADARGAFSMTVPPGTYTVNISAPGYIAQSKSVVLKEGERTIFNVDLFPK